MKRKKADSSDLYEKVGKFLHLAYERLIVSKCPSCRAVTRHSGTFCGKCLEKYVKERDSTCPFCEMTASNCVCSTRDLKYNGSFAKSLHSFVFYRKENEVLTNAIYSLKRSPDRNAEKLFAREMASQLLHLAFENECDIGEWYITFPPRGRKSVALYGFDHAKGLAKKVSKLTGATFEEVFERRGSKKQKTLNFGGRKRNAEKSFCLKKNITVEGKKYIIIDDVITTGATVNACEKLLFCGRAKEVFVFSIAKTLKPGKGYDRKEVKRKPENPKNLWFNGEV